MTEREEIIEEIIKNLKIKARRKVDHYPCGYTENDLIVELVYKGKVISTDKVDMLDMID